jgi:hypothetical protein
MKEDKMKKYLIMVIIFTQFTLPGLAGGQESLNVDLQKRIAELEKTIINYESRIAALEVELAQLKVILGIQSSTKESPRAILNASIGWKESSNWEKIKNGMSEKQVIAILGKPTSISDGVFRILYYQGEVPGSGYVSGNVKLTDDRVYLLEKPVF